MSKLTKNDLKDIVKECLIEILSEGLIPKRRINKAKLSESSLSNKNSNKRIAHEAINKKSYLDSVNFERLSNKPKINTDISDNPILNEIFADTANSTLQEQLSHESRHTANSVVVNGDAASKIVAENKIESIFGDEISSKWSQLAFFDKK